MYIRLKTVKTYDDRGRQRTYRPGDWLDVPKQTALLWISRGEAEIVSTKAAAEISSAGCGVVCSNKTAQMITGKFPGVELDYGEPRTAFHKTLILADDTPLRLELVAVGFNLLGVWEMAIPLASYRNLANSIGSAEERAITQELVHDLRIPYYDGRMIFARRCKAADEVIKLWRADVAAGCNRDLSLLRAVYHVKPLLLSLPVTWTAGRGAY